MAPSKVARRVVRILVLTVRSDAGRTRVTLVSPGTNRTVSPHAPERGKSLVLVGGESGSRSVTQLNGHGLICLNALAVMASSAMNARMLGQTRNAHGRRSMARGGVGANHRMAVSRDGKACLISMLCRTSSRDYHRADMVPIRRVEETSVVSRRTGRVESSR